MSLLDKLKKNSTIKETEVLNKSKFFNKKDIYFKVFFLIIFPRKNVNINKKIIFEQKY